MTSESAAGTPAAVDLPFDVTETRAHRVRRALWRFVRRQPVGAVSGLVVLFFVVIALLVVIFGNSIAPFDPREIGAGARFGSPSWDHPFGTDIQGRDMFSRLLIGTKLSMIIGLLALAIGVGGGATIGILSGFLRGKVDFVVQRLTDAMQAFPSLVLILVFALAFGASARIAVIALGISLIPAINRVVRSSTFQLREEQFVEGALAVGASTPRIIFRHVLPNLIAPLIIIASILIGFAILTEAGLAFIGLGEPPPAQSWGREVNTGRQFMEDAPWLVLAPGLAITIVVLAFNMFGDALRDHLDPRLRGTR